MQFPLPVGQTGLNRADIQADSPDKLFLSRDLGFNNGFVTSNWLLYPSEHILILIIQHAEYQQISIVKFTSI